VNNFIMKSGSMSLFDLLKATVVCGIVAFLFYSYPVIGQVVAVVSLTLLWLSYARKALLSFRRNRAA